MFKGCSWDMQYSRCTSLLIVWFRVTGALTEMPVSTRELQAHSPQTRSLIYPGYSDHPLPLNTHAVHPSSSSDSESPVHSQKCPYLPALQAHSPHTRSPLPSLQNSLSGSYKIEYKKKYQIIFPWKLVITSWLEQKLSLSSFLILFKFTECLAKIASMYYWRSTFTVGTHVNKCDHAK